MIKLLIFFIFVLVFSLLGVGYAFYIDFFFFQFFEMTIWASREKKPLRKYIIENME